MTTQTFSSRLQGVQSENGDYEWYPTTNEILDRLATSISAFINRDYRRRDFRKFLDIGAGDGKVLSYIKEKDLAERFYAIEKSQSHLSNLDSSVFILGVDFHKVTLLDKEIDIIFCNPPYKEYETWAAKIIREAPNASVVYLVIPERWRKSAEIDKAVRERDVKIERKGSFSFVDSEDRVSRANVELLEIQVKDSRYDDRNDPFTIFFEENFSFPKYQEEDLSLDKRIEKEQIVKGRNFIEILCFLHDKRIEELKENYAAICKLDRNLLDEFEISKAGLISSLKMKLATTKKEFWKRLFDRMEGIKKRLTCKTRDHIVGLMQDQTGIDFNRENAYAIVLWVIKNANQYFDKQFIEFYEKLVSLANVEGYVSNRRVFKENEFRYHYMRESENRPTHYRLKVGHRIVLENCGGLYKCPYMGINRGMEDRAYHFLEDILTIANNLGFTHIENLPNQEDWKDSGAREIHCKFKGEKKVLFKVRAYQNGNMHIHFLPEFVHALNIQFGKLKGWISSEKEAESEIETPTDLTKEFFPYKVRIGVEQLMLG